MKNQAISWRLHLEALHSLIHVETTVQLKDGDRFSLPAWIPGSYMVREFVRGLQDLRVQTLDGEDVTLEHPDKATWVVRLETPQQVVIRYAIYGRELTVRTAHIDDTHAFFNGANVFLRFEGRAHLPQQVEIAAPETWTAFVSLPQHEGRFTADNYVHLADTAFEIGPHPSFEFQVDGIPHRMIFWGADGLLDKIPQLQADTIALMEQNRDTFQRPLPYERYDIIFHVTPSARGGLEHRDSTTLATPWAYFETEEGYLDMLTLIAHEHFHAYNGRRLAPASLEHIDYSQENYLSELWVIEGFTSYFDELNTLRAGLMTQEQWLERTAKAFSALYRTYGRTRQSLTEASHDAWIRLYRPYEHTRNQTVSYYLKGSLVALAIDLRLRERSGGEVALEHVLQSIWREWQDHNVHYTTESVLRRIGELGGDVVEEDARQWVTGTDEPPYAELLASHGIQWAEEDSKPADFGIVLEPSQDPAVVSSLDEARYDAIGALRPGDEIVALNKRRVRRNEIEARLVALSKGPEDVHTFTVFRLGRQREVSVVLKSAPQIQLSFFETDADNDAAVKTRRSGFFGTEGGQ